MLECPTETRREVTVSMVETVYEKKVKITKEPTPALNCDYDDRMPKWNYTIRSIPNDDSTPDSN